MPLLEKTTPEGAPSQRAASEATVGDPLPAKGAAPVPDQSRAERRTSFDPADFPVPTGREEEWRFTPVDRLGALIGESVAEGTAAAAASGASRAALGWHATGPDGVGWQEISSEQARDLGIRPPADRAAARAFAETGRVRLLAIPAEAELFEPVVVDLVGADGRAATGQLAGAAAFGHVVITVGRFARATIVLRHRGGEAYSELVSVLTEDGADLTLVTLQDWDDEALHLSQQDVTVGRDAQVRHITVTLGGRIVRVNTNTTYAGPGGRFEGLGVYFADAGQHLEHRLFVDHDPPHCASDVNYRGALQGETARTVWVGDVLIRAAAEGTDTYEINRNLVLTDGARADSVPNLEIETGEIIGAGHATATGRFDEEQLFYLQSRGIPEVQARRLVVRGFFAELVERIGVPQIAERVMTAIEEELSVSMGSLGALPGAETAVAEDVEDLEVAR